jgi:hypothetical protein
VGRLHHEQGVNAAGTRNGRGPRSPSLDIARHEILTVVSRPDRASRDEPVAVLGGIARVVPGDGEFYMSNDGGARFTGVSCSLRLSRLAPRGESATGTGSRDA